jgi:hypothetical protein
MLVPKPLNVDREERATRYLLKLGYSPSEHGIEPLEYGEPVRAQHAKLLWLARALAEHLPAEDPEKSATLDLVWAIGVEAEETADTHDIAMFMQTIGLMHLRWGEMRKARCCLVRAADWFEKAGEDHAATHLKIVVAQMQKPVDALSRPLFATA